MTKKKKQGNVRRITLTPSAADVQTSLTDRRWFEQHPGYRGRLRAYIPGEFDGMPSPEREILDTLQYVYVKNLGGGHRMRIPYMLDPLEIVTLIILGSVDEDDLNTVVSTARQLTSHAEIVSEPGGNHKLWAYCTAAQKPTYEDFIQCVFVGAKRYEG